VFQLNSYSTALITNPHLVLVNTHGLKTIENVLRIACQGLITRRMTAIQILNIFRIMFSVEQQCLSFVLHVTTTRFRYIQ